MQESDLFRTIKDGFTLIVDEVKNEDIRAATSRLIEMNEALEGVIDHYSENHDMVSSTMTINLDHCALVRNLLLLDVVWVIGPVIYSKESDVNWNEFSDLSFLEPALRHGFGLIYSQLSESDVNKIVITALKAGIIEDLEVAGVVYSIFYFIHFILKVETFHLPYSSCVDYFYSHISSYSFVLLITCILSLQKSVFYLILLPNRVTEGANGSIIRSVVLWV